MTGNAQTSPRRPTLHCCSARCVRSISVARPLARCGRFRSLPYLPVRALSPFPGVVVPMCGIDVAWPSLFGFSFLATSVWQKIPFTSFAHSHCLPLVADSDGCYCQHHYLGLLCQGVGMPCVLRAESQRAVTCHLTTRMRLTSLLTIGFDCGWRTQHFA